MQTAASPNPWLVTTEPRPKAALRLFCFPYAGGSAAMYRDWPAALPVNVEVCAVQPPGRGRRIAEAPYSDLTLLARSLTRAIRSYCDRPIAVFGHSMGAKLGFEFARLLRREHGLQPVHLFLSACRASPFPDPEPFYDLPRAEFIEKLRGLNGTPAEVLDHPELMELLLPLLRADFQAIQTHGYANEPPLDCPITAFGGLLDHGISRAQLDGWREQTTAEFSMQMFPGDHFYFRRSESFLLQAVSDRLRRALKELEVPRNQPLET